jgi:hypothetical protein
MHQCTVISLTKRNGTLISVCQSKQKQLPVINSHGSYNIFEVIRTGVTFYTDAPACSNSVKINPEIASCLN